MIQASELFLIGQTHKPHGLRGDLTCSFSDTVFDDEDIPFLMVEIDHIFVPFYLEEYRFKTDTAAIVKFEDVNSEAEARTLADKAVYLPLKYRRDREPEEFTLQDMVGFEVMDTAIGHLGKIAVVDDSTLNVLFQLEDGRMFPAHDELVENVDYQNRILTVRLPEGMLDVNG